jgi:hypothetical protein
MQNFNVFELWPLIGETSRGGIQTFAYPGRCFDECLLLARSTTIKTSCHIDNDDAM